MEPRLPWDSLCGQGIILSFESPCLSHPVLPIQVCTAMPSSCGAGHGAQGFLHTRQMLYRLSYSFRPVVSFLRPSKEHARFCSSTEGWWVGDTGYRDVTKFEVRFTSPNPSGCL